MITVLLIRHGENDFIGKRLAGRLAGVHLNDKGREQAAVLAQHLHADGIQAIYSSPLERAMETAQPLAQRLSLPVIPHAALMEVDFGEWQGVEIETLHQHDLWKVVQETPSRMRFPGGESFAEAQQRVVSGLQEICTRHADGARIACFSHCDAIRLALAHFLGMPLDGFQRLIISTASVSVLHFEEKRVRLARSNATFEFSPQPADG
ncbi:MAG: MSMEG_4193 family putative phosphomutase [Anaerolineae bacterium]|nr:MSMEG_4193 family putative phosphomutase [Anaerolineae bacterium]